MAEPLTADQIVEKAASEVEAERLKAEAEAGGGGGGESEGDKPKPKEPAAEDFSDDDLDPEKIEAGMTAKTLALDNAGLLKRFKKVHATAKELKAWRAEREPKLPGYEQQAKAVDRMLQGLAKLRPKDAPDKQTPLEDLLENLLEEKGTPNWKAANEFISQILAAVEGQQAGGENKAGALDGETPVMRQMRERLERVERDRETEKLDATQRQAQAELDNKMATAFSSIPKELDKIEEFKGLPWKDKVFKKEFDDEMDDKILAWSSRNEDKLKAGEFPPVVEIAKQVAKIYFRGGSDVLKRQVEGKPRTAGLNRGNGPSGEKPRELPKLGDRDDENRYLDELVSDLKS